MSNEILPAHAWRASARITARRVALLLILAPFTLGSSCDSGGIGDPCTPEDEYQPDFSGYALTEANVESKSFSCASRVCLVNHFQGRVSCPYGQTSEDLSQSPDAPGRCRVPGTSGESTEDAVTVSVPAWDLDRPASDAVYCSCRCAGPDPNARYCECPDGFVCAETVPDFGRGQAQLVGSYCVRAGTEYRRAYENGPDCHTNPEDGRCPGEPGVNP